MDGQGQQNSNTTLPTVVSEDRNLIDLTTKKEEKNQEDVAMTDPNAEGMCGPTYTKEKHTLLEELHHAHSNSSSSSADEMEEGGESKKRKKGLKDKIKQKLSGEKEKECNKHSENAMENFIEVENAEATNMEEKKGFLDKIKEKLPGHHKKTEGAVAAGPCTNEDSPGDATKEKKGLMEKIIGKLPGHQNNEHEPKEKEN